jgi:magnesium transporter
VNSNNILVGRITVEDVVDLIREEADETMLNMAGLNEDEDMFAPVLQKVRKRGLWLFVNLLTALLAASVISQFEAALSQVVALAILMPLVASMGGIAGTQTLTLIVRALALGQVNNDNARALLKKEFSVGAVNGIMFALVIGSVAGLWFQSAALGLVIGLAIIANLVVAALAGVAVPMALQRLNIDPALAGGVALTTLTDVIGFCAFLGLGSLFLL